MNSFSVVILSALLFASVSWIAEAQITCPGAGAQCSASTFVSIRVNGAGSCNGFASANCNAYSFASDKCVKKIDKAIRLKKCKRIDIIRAAKCTAKAVASVYAKAYAQIKCSGHGKGCGYANGKGNAWACSFAATLVNLHVSVGADQAVCQAQISAMAGVFAAVATEAQALACAKGNNFQKDFQTEYGFRVEQILVKSFAACWVKCKGSTASSTTSGGAQVSPTTTSGGNADTNVGGTFGLPFDPFDRRL